MFVLQSILQGRAGKLSDQLGATISSHEQQLDLLWLLQDKSATVFLDAAAA
jgi:hypothetical protein